MNNLAAVFFCLGLMMVVGGLIGTVAARSEDEEMMGVVAFGLILVMLAIFGWTVLGYSPNT